MLSIRQRFALWAAPALTAASIVAPQHAAADTMSVTNNFDYAFATSPADGDGNGCNLRKALQNAADGAQTFNDCPITATTPGEYIITFADSATINMGTIGVMPFINKPVTLTGPKTIQGINTGLGQDEIFQVAGGGSLTLTGFTLTGAGDSAVRVQNTGHFAANASAFNGNKTDVCCGGAINSAGTIALANVTFDSNTATGAGGQGGAIYLSNSGTNTITDASFTNNSAAQDGGAIYVNLTGAILPGGTLTITNGVFFNNTASGASATMGGGAIHARASGVAFVSLLNNQFIGNKADGNDGRGGGIYSGLSDAYPLIVDHAVFLLNTASANAGSMGGAIYNADNMIVRASSFVGNAAGPGNGGAIATDARPPDNVPTPPEPGAIIANSTFNGNTAAEGAAIYSFGQFTPREVALVNVTIDGNTASGTGGGIRTDNIGGGTATTRLLNTIVSNNSPDNCTNDTAATQTNNVVGNLQFPGATCAADSAITTGDPKLNGASINPPDVLTVTMSLQPGSAASNAGNNAVCAGFPILNLDQRSLVVPIRPAGGPNCDIGAYESTMAPGYGSAPAPGSTITITTVSGLPMPSNVVISETGDDNLTISSYSIPGGPELVVAGTAAPFTINEGSGLTETLTLTCSSAVPFTTTQTLTVNHNATGSPATYTVNCIVVDPLVITTASPLPGGVVGTPYSQTFAASGGTPPYVNWQVTAGTLPPGLALNPVTGELSGTPTTTVGSPFNFTVQVSDSTGAPLTTTKVFDLTIVDAPVITTATPMPGGTTGVPYGPLTFTATGGTGVYTNWALTAGTPPPGLVLDPGTGLVNGTPTLAGVYNFDITVTDSGAQTGTKNFTLTVVDPLVITTATPLAQGTQGAVYPTLTFAATGGTAPYVNWIVTVGALPTGITLGAGTGQLAGTPTVNGTFNFTVQVTDNVGVMATKAFSLTINPPVTITTATPMPGGTQGIAYSQTFAATGGTTPYVNWVVTLGTLPPGLTLAAGTGALTGTPTTPGPYNFTVQVTDSVGATATKVFDLTIVAPLTITTGTPMPDGVVGVPYNQVFAATGGTPGYSNWIVTVGTLPAGLTLNPATGALTGTPTLAGTSNFTVQVQDSVAVTTTKAFSLTINAGLTITTPTPLPNGTQGIAYSLTFTAAGGTPGYSNWMVTVGALPTGITLNPATGALTGTPTVNGLFNFTVQVQDSVAVTTTKAFALTIGPPVSITTATPLPAGTVGAAYSQTFAATGGTPGYSNWIVTVGTLPTGLTLNPATGALTGTPTVAGTSNFTVQVQDSVAQLATKAFALTINPGPLTITTATPLPGGTVGTAYSQTFAAAGGTPGYSNWMVTVGTLPAGLTLNPATGALTGTPTTAGTSNFTVQVQDSLAVTTTKAFALTIAPTAPSITTATPLPNGTVGTAYSQTFAATGGTPPYTTWAVTVGTLPAGLTLNAGTGALTGTPTTAGTSNFTIQVTDTGLATATKAFALTINAGALSITTATPMPGGTVGTAYSQTFAAAGGTPPYVNWVVTVGTLPPGLTLAATTGALTGTPTTATGSPFSFTVQVTDNVGGTATKAFTLPVVTSSCFTGAASSGNATACVSGGGPTCAFTPGTAQFIPLTGHPSSPPAGTAPSGIMFPHGLFAFTLSGCTPGASISMTVTYPTALPPGVQYWKYGPTPSTPTPGWYILPATFGATTATFSIVDGGLGDDDLLANGTVVDQGGPGVPGAGGTGAEQTPTLSEWAMVILALLILAVAGLGRRRPAGLR